MSLPSSKTVKQTLRKSLIEARESLDDATRKKADQAIASHVEHWLRANPVETLGIFYPIRREPDLLPLYERLSEQGTVLALPIVVDKNAPLQFAQWAPGEPLKKDALGVPVPNRLIFGATPQAVLVPCVGFNDARYRLGYGGGFFDRTLKTDPRPSALGIAYACLRTTFDPGQLDVAMDWIITEEGVI